MPNATRKIERRETRYFGRPGHEYHVDGVKTPGVTTLIGKGLPKPALVDWAAREVAGYVARERDVVRALLDNSSDAQVVDALKSAHRHKRDAAAVRGTDVHSMADDLMHGREVDPGELRGYVDACVRFLDEWQVEPLVTEAVVASREWGYCGTLDFVGRLPDGTIVLGDYKTSASGIFGDVALQLAAYAHADVYLDAQGEEQSVASLGITRGLGVSLLDGSYAVHELSIGEAPWRAFLHVAWVGRNVTRDTTNAWRSEALYGPDALALSGVAA